MKFTHIDENGSIKMVNVTDKSPTVRTAFASGEIRMSKDTIDAIRSGAITKGNVLCTAKIAGITAAKRTGEMIPLCHPLPLEFADIEFSIKDTVIVINSCVQTSAKTGIEMEALHAVAAAALTIYDMCKAVDKDMIIDNIRLIKKTGGKTLYMRGKVKSINISEKRGTKKHPVNSAELVKDLGIKNDSHAEAGSIRQLSLLSWESAEKMIDKIPELKPGDFAENITVTGFIVSQLPVGTIIKFSGGAELEVTKIGKECHHHCEIYQQVGMCVMPEEGIFARVLKSAEIKKDEELSVCIPQQ